MEFKEASDDWQSIPDWASFLIEFGFAWIVQPRASRRIAVISMPADSAAAGLVALGTMRKCLELDDANDMCAHHKRLQVLALEARKNPPGVKLRHIRWNGEFAFDGFTENGDPMVKRLKSKVNRRDNIGVRPQDWHIDGEAPVVLGNGQQVPNAQLYSNLVQGGKTIKPSNLSESHSQICLAGRGTGEAPTKSSMEGIRFREGSAEADLSQLLTIQNWMPRTISRVMFYNSLTQEFDRQSGKPRVVIADGDTSFRRVVDGNDFLESDVVGVIHRTMERDRLEAVGTKLENLRQWYDQDGSVLDWLPEGSRGIGFTVLKRRQTCQ